MADTDQPGVVAIVGAGLIGRAWAVVFARAGWTVRLTDLHGPTLDAAPSLIRDELQALHAHGLVDDPAGGAARVSPAASLAEAVAGAATRGTASSATAVVAAARARRTGRFTDPSHHSP